MTVSETYRFYFLLLVLGSTLVYISEKNIAHRAKITMTKKELITVRPWSLLFKILALYILGMPLAMRDCGADKYNYYSRYVRDKFDLMDGLFDLLRNFIHKFIADPKLGIGLIGCICLIVAMTTITSSRDEIESSLSWFAFVASLYFYLYNYVRMMCAATLVVVAFTYMIKGKNKPALICLLIASWFHLSAAVVFLVYVTMQYFIKYWRLFIGLIIIGTIVFVYNPVFFLSLVKVDRYLSQVVLENVSESTIGIGTFLRIFPIFLIQIYYLKRFKQDKIYNQLLILSIVNIGISLIGYYVGTASRLANMYFVTHLLFAVPWIIKRLETPREKTYIRIFFVVYTIFYYYLETLNFEKMMIVPYR